jgi:flagellar motility protein MotE (MotC chaperone)
MMIRPGAVAAAIVALSLGATAALAQKPKGAEETPLLWVPVAPALPPKTPAPGASMAPPAPKPPEPAPPSAAVPKAATEVSPMDKAAMTAFCNNIADLAADARFMRQKQELERLDREVQQKALELDRKRVQLQEWIARREDYIRKAEDTVARVFAKVKPDAASAQLEAMDEETAAALLMRLPERSATAALNDMSSEKAARLVSIMVGAAKRTPLKAAPSSQAPQAEPPPPSSVQATPAGNGENKS